MEIRINDKPLDFSLDDENNLGEVLAGLEQWLASAGHRIAKLSIDGQEIKTSMIEDAFTKNVDSIKSLNIQTNIIAELTTASLMSILNDIKDFENLGAEEKNKFFNNWNETAQAQYVSAEIPDLYAYCISTFSHGDMLPQTLCAIIEEIQREVNDPVNELKNIEQILKDICARLIDIPLDIQTGKDARAAQTIQVFSAVTEKIFRIFRQLDTQGYLSVISGQKTLSHLITQFGNVLKELLEAYEKNDTVLVGDITEYEASPKIKELYYAILENIKSTDALQGNARIKV
ncbi:MAG: hypothetical protein FWD13_01605 [Treponema sp.]|nr:hypothetical protein [Treponema sp.]